MIVHVLQWGASLMKRFMLFLQNTVISFWFLPAIIIAAAMVAAFVLLDIDQSHSFPINRSLIGLFGGQPDGARQLLGSIAGAVITVISISFSITILALQQLATQYSPRVLRNFTADRGNQVVLGTYLGTFIYSLLVLRMVHAETDDQEAFVPSLSISFAITLTTLCIALLIYFISRISNSLQVERVVQNVHRELMEQLEELFPEQIGEEDPEPVATPIPPGRTCVVRSERSGFLQAIDEHVLQEFRWENVSLVRVRPQVGEFIAEGEVVVEVVLEEGECHAEFQHLGAALVVGYQRSLLQDPLFPLGQLVDIALRALSTGINDPATAENVLYQITDALCTLSNRRFPPSSRTFPNSRITFVFNAPTWEQFVEHGYAQIRRVSGGNVRMMVSLTEQLCKLRALTPNPHRREAIDQQLYATREQVMVGELTSSDRQMLLAKLSKALGAEVARDGPLSQAPLPVPVGSG